MDPPAIPRHARAIHMVNASHAPGDGTVAAATTGTEVSTLPAWLKVRVPSRWPFVTGAATLPGTSHVRVMGPARSKSGTEVVSATTPGTLRSR